MSGSQFCLFGSFVRLSGRGVALIFDVQFHEYFSITILTLISFFDIRSTAVIFRLFSSVSVNFPMVSLSFILRRC